MTRKTKEVIITDEGNRDKGKVFVITEPSSYECEQIALRFFSVVGRKRKDKDDPTADEGMAGVASIYDPSNPDFQHLLSQLMGCVKYQHAPGHPLQVIKEGEECQIDEVSTRMKLKHEAFELITGFSLAG